MISLLRSYLVYLPNPFFDSIASRNHGLLSPPIPTTARSSHLPCPVSSSKMPTFMRTYQKQKSFILVYHEMMETPLIPLSISHHCIKLEASFTIAMGFSFYAHGIWSHSKMGYRATTMFATPPPKNRPLSLYQVWTLGL